MEEENSAGNYFESYDNISVHNLMLRDFPRVFKYREAIMASKAAFKDKIVMDVGSGTGLLSLFCAQAGAKHVYAVEASEGIYELSKAIVKANNLEDRITIINGVIEEIELPNGITKVDIIVSEWMGVYLLHESMLKY
jgi:predicted RNA methylase